MLLVEAGVPFDLAFAVPDWKATGLYVALGEAKGSVFNWSTMRWDKSAG